MAAKERPVRRHSREWQATIHDTVVFKIHNEGAGWK
jgi:hypothetical protein